MDGKTSGRCGVTCDPSGLTTARMCTTDTHPGTRGQLLTARVCHDSERTVNIRMEKHGGGSIEVSAQGCTWHVMIRAQTAETNCRQRTSL
jgi:hypothetical protein